MENKYEQMASVEQSLHQLKLFKSKQQLKQFKKKIMTKQELTATVQAQAEKIIRLETEKNNYKKFWELNRELNTKKTKLVEEFIEDMKKERRLESIKKKRIVIFMQEKTQLQ